MRSIEIFVAAYEHRSFTLAAEHSNATQSGVSQHVRKLEQLHGVKLFRREGGRVTPTPAADAFYISCAKLLRAREAAIRGLKGFAPGLDGEVKVGLMPTVTAGALAPSLLTFKRNHPNAAVKVFEGYSGVLTDHLMAGEIDFAVVPSMVLPAGLSARPFIRTPELFVSRLTRERSISPIDLRRSVGLSLVLPGTGNMRADTIRTYIATNHIELTRVLELDSMMATLDLLVRSEWTAILPALLLASETLNTRLSYRRLLPGLSLDLIVLERAKRSLTPLADDFCQTLRAQCEKLLTQASLPPELRGAS